MRDVLGFDLSRVLWNVEPLWQLGLGGAESYPERPDEADCMYYLRTGSCGYGSRCRFNHPRDRGAVILWNSPSSRSIWLNLGLKWNVSFVFDVIILLFGGKFVLILALRLIMIMGLQNLSILISPIDLKLLEFSFNCE